MKKIANMLMVFTLVFGCTNAQSKDVPYKEAKRYYVKNNYPERNLHMLKITTQDVFDSIFGAAALMGNDGTPTPIDFSKSFIIALIDDSNNQTEDIKISALTKEGDNLSLKYAIETRKEPSSAYFRICKLLIVDNKFIGNVTASIPEVVGSDLDDSGCKPSTGFSWSVLLNECFQPWTSEYILEGQALNGAGNAAMIFNNDKSLVEIVGFQNQKNLVLTKNADKNVWKNGDFSITENPQNQFIFKNKDKEIAQGKLRK